MFLKTILNINISMEEDALRKTKEIETQVERWDLFAKIVPPLFLLVCSMVLIFDLLEFQIMFYIGIGIISTTSVVWWFWAIFSMRFLVRLFRRATENLIIVSHELTEVKEELKDLYDEESNRR